MSIRLPILRRMLAHWGIKMRLGTACFSEDSAQAHLGALTEGVRAHD